MGLICLLLPIEGIWEAWSLTMLFVFCVCISVLLYLCFQMWVLGGVGIAVLLLLHFASSQKLGAGTGSGSCRAFPYRAENVSNLFWYSASFLWTFWQREGHFWGGLCILLLYTFEQQRALFLSESTFYQRTSFLLESTFLSGGLFYQVDWEVCPPEVPCCNEYGYCRTKVKILLFFH